MLDAMPKILVVVVVVVVVAVAVAVAVRTFRMTMEEDCTLSLNMS